jgi:hypothetical protein
MSSGAQNMKTRPDTLRPAKNVPRSANMKMGPDDLGTTENESGHAKHENGTRHPPYRRKLVRELKIGKRVSTPSVPPKMSQGKQNMNTGQDTLGTAEDVSGNVKHKNGTRRPLPRQKHVRERKT